MSQIMLNVCDASRTLHCTIHASRVDCLVAVLAADPETIDELQEGLKRFLPEAEVDNFFRPWLPGFRPGPWDAGMCCIDLAARLVLMQSTYSLPGQSGEVDMVDPPKDRVIGVPYHLADDWLFIREPDMWTSLAQERRRAAPCPSSL
jgi:hypothetical protein